MDQRIVVSSAVGGVVGLVLGIGLGRHIERKESTMEKGLAPELLGILGAIAGGVGVAAVAQMMAPPPQPAVAIGPATDISTTPSASV